MAFYYPSILLVGQVIGRAFRSKNYSRNFLLRKPLRPLYWTSIHTSLLSMHCLIAFWLVPLQVAAHLSYLRNWPGFTTDTVAPRGAWPITCPFRPACRRRFVKFWTFIILDALSATPHDRLLRLLGMVLVNLTFVIIWDFDAIGNSLISVVGG